MHANYFSFRSPRFRILSDKQIEELHFATLQILERTGVAFECQEAIEILGDAGADVSDPNRVKIPSHLVEQGLRTAPKMITLYTREGEPAMTLNGMTGSHFGTVVGGPEYLDPYIRKRRQCYVEDIADAARVTDALPNIEWLYAIAGYRTLPGSIADKVSLLQAILNTSKPIACSSNDVFSLKEMLEICYMVVGGEEQLRAKPFLTLNTHTITPLLQGKDATEIGLLCAEKGIPNGVVSGLMAGSTAPATFPGCLAIANAEVLSHLVVLQLKYPGAPVFFGSMPTIMDMKTTIFSYGAPEMSLMMGAMTELAHYYKLPILGVAGCTDAEIIDAQAGAEVMYQILISMLTGADLIRVAGFTYHSVIVSPELFVFVDEIIDMVKVLMDGIEINDETLPLDLIEQKGPRANYLTEAHTLKHFRKFWVPRVFDRSFKKEDAKSCEELLNERTVEILKTHQPKPLPEDLVRELKKMEKTWFDRVGLKHEYPERERNIEE